MTQHPQHAPVALSGWITARRAQVEQALESVKAELLPLLQQWFAGVLRVSVRAAGGSAPPPTRLTDEMVRSERLTALRRRDPVLGAAIDALDLDLAD